ncbi:MAG: geranylgeranyl reductase [Rhizobacter sp.]|nr:geranylgeranyl reductase [Rhizobacter sp.]
MLPNDCDVLVIGAGPAGSAAARTLAAAGLSVVLAEQHQFPRDKICGDALIPDAHAALRKLGLLDTVMARATSVSTVTCIGPRGGRIDVPGTLAVLPRKELDQLLCDASVDVGAVLAMPARFMAPIEADGRVVGARLQVDDVMHELRARWVILATGAVPAALTAAGMCERHTPSGVALRGYVKNDAMVGRIHSLEIVWHRALSPGYGWIFPCPDGVFNIGVGLANSHVESEEGRGSKKRVNLRDVFDDFVRTYPPAAELMAGGQLLGALKGAPLRCSLNGARFSRPGLIVTGEAAGSTYSFTGEGIGKALETGILAAEAILAGRERMAATAIDDDESVRADYEAHLRALKPRFALYEKANQVNRHPWLADLLIWRGRKSARILRRMAGVLDETSNPGNLVTMKGLVRLFTE